MFLLYFTKSRNTQFLNHASNLDCVQKCLRKSKLSFKIYTHSTFLETLTIIINAKHIDYRFSPNSKWIVLIKTL